MKSGSLPLRARSRPICQLCDYILQQPAHRRSFLTASTLRATPSIRRPAARQHGVLPRIPARIMTTAAQAQTAEPEVENDQQLHVRIADLKAKLAEVERQIRTIFASPKVESEETILGVLDELFSIARQAIAIRTRQPPPEQITIRQSSAGSILSLNRDEPEPRVGRPKSKISKSINSTGNLFSQLPSPTYLSDLAKDLLKDEKVFISPNVLKVYVRLQRLLGCPRALPEILYLYANKPVPELGSSPPKYIKVSPKAAKQAIPAELAEEALTAAIETKDMPLALDVVQMTYCAPAWRRHRMLSKLGVPGTLAAITPLALYMIAQELSVYSGYLDPWTFKVYSFAGLLTYVGCTGTLGFVALTTHNDHFDRVVWRPGVPLLDRYLREDERAALDRIACAWGFKESWRRGDEEGEEWEGLREWILLRGMILDKPDLMEGMNA
ncbi:hypothetical protein BS50DRAFT_171609 [Corynespora cassiicola Philippines]|uniref:Uncharacterized protein n=1 Tax=Corynespora cassiicola Philippines TaxID=1448308 RepID=A0A2T2P5E8_CORCC|nr:hypothetical protein BS50DRAFT_171609 [Corynespora cassiicola Philippines]